MQWKILLYPRPKHPHAIHTALCVKSVLEKHETNECEDGNDKKTRMKISLQFRQLRHCTNECCWAAHMCLVNITTMSADLWAFLAQQYTRDFSIKIQPRQQLLWIDFQFTKVENVNSRYCWKISNFSDQVFKFIIKFQTLQRITLEKFYKTRKLRILNNQLTRDNFQTIKLHCFDDFSLQHSPFSHFHYFFHVFFLCIFCVFFSI